MIDQANNFCLCKFEYSHYSLRLIMYKYYREKINVNYFGVNNNNQETPSPFPFSNITVFITTTAYNFYSVM